MCLQPRNDSSLTPSIVEQLQRIMNKQRNCTNGPQMRSLNDEERSRFYDVRACCIHCIKGPYMTFSQKPDTYATAINILDAFLWRMKVKDDFMSIVGVACFSIAAKITEDDENMPGLTDLAECSGHSWKAGDLCRMEGLIMSKLGWDLPTGTYLQFLPLFAEACGIATSQAQDERVILLAERCLRQQSTMLMSPAVLALALVSHLSGVEEPLAKTPWLDLIALCDINSNDLLGCKQIVSNVSSPSFSPRRLPAFCPRVRHGRKQFCRPSNQGSPKLSTILEVA